MPNKDDIIRMQHMLEASKDALSFVQKQTRSSLDTDKMLQLSLVRCIEIIGEASSKLSRESYDKFPQIKAIPVVKTRSRAVFGVEEPASVLSLSLP